jgi:hypothetical protein
MHVAACIIAISDTLDCAMVLHTNVLSLHTQLGEFTLKRHAMATLPREIESHHDFISVFGAATASSTTNASGSSRSSATIGCAEVKNSEHRKWLRLVGRRHDVQVRAYAMY